MEGTRQEEAGRHRTAYGLIGLLAACFARWSLSWQSQSLHFWPGGGREGSSFALIFHCLIQSTSTHSTSSSFGRDPGQYPGQGRGICLYTHTHQATTISSHHAQADQKYCHAQPLEKNKHTTFLGFLFFKRNQTTSGAACIHV